MVYDKKINDLKGFLRALQADEIIIRTTRINIGWFDVEFDANLAGFKVYRCKNEAMEARHEFSSCYHFVRK